MRISRTLPRAFAAAGGVSLVLSSLVSISAASTITSPAAPATPRFVIPDLNDAGGAVPLSRAGVSALTVDFNDDGDVDALIPNLNRAGVVVLLGDGSGGLDDPTMTTLPDAGSVVAAAAGDVDGDATIDVVAATYDDEGPAVRVLLGNGDGTFQVGQRINFSTAVAVMNLAVADLDDDGDLDFAASVDRNTGDTVDVAMGRGDGTFMAPTVYQPPFSIGVDDIDIADVNSDGAPDLVYLEGCPAVRLNDGDGVFGDKICSTDPDGRLSGVAFDVVDLDGDGAPDLAIGDASGGHVTIALGDGAGKFVFEVQYEKLGRQVNSVLAADFTGDGELDVIASADAYESSPTRIMTLLRGKGDGTFQRVASYATGGDGLADADLDGDGDLDLVSAGYGDRKVSATTNLGKGVFRAPRAYTVPNEGSVGTIVRTADVNGDGRADVVSATRAGRVNVFLQKKNGELKTPALSTPGTGEILSLAVGDVNKDGRDDIVAGSQPSNNVFVMRGGSDGKLGAPTAHNNGSQAAVLGVALGDVDGDGKLDIVSNTFSQISVLPGNGSGGFGAPVLSGVAGGFQIGTVLTDVNRDGDLDAVSVVRTGNNDDAQSKVFVNTGNGTRSFTAGQQVTIDTNAQDATGIVLTGKRPGVAVVGTRGNHTGRTGLYLLPASSSGQLGSTYLGGPGFGVTAADLNGDKKQDLATVGDTTITFFTGANGTVTANGSMPSGPSAFGVAAGNLIGNKRIDVVEVDETNPQQIVVYENKAG